MQGVNFVFTLVTFGVIGTSTTGETTDGHSVNVAGCADDVDVFVDVFTLAGSCAADDDHALGLGAFELLEECLGGFGSEGL